MKTFFNRNHDTNFQIGFSLRKELIYNLAEGCQGRKAYIGERPRVVSTRHSQLTSKTMPDSSSQLRQSSQEMCSFSVFPKLSIFMQFS